jgi:capsid protein
LFSSAGPARWKRTTGFSTGSLDDFETYVVGDELVYLPNTGNEDANKAIREYLEWQFDEADYAGIHDLTKIAQLAVRSMKRDGECAFARSTWATR